MTRSARFNNGLIVAEIAMATVLLIAGGLVIRSFVKLSTIDPGYDSRNVITFQLAVPPTRYDLATRKAFAEQLVERLETLPAVRGAAYARQLPTVNDRDTLRFRTTPAYPQDSPLMSPGEDARIVSRHYFSVLGIRVIAGRGFTDDDRAGQPRVLVINQSLARLHFGAASPVGKLAYVGRSQDPWQIVGVVNDVRQFGLSEAPEPQVFVDMRQWSGGRASFEQPRYFAVRTAGSPSAFVPEIRNIVRAIDPAVGVFNANTMDDLLSNAVSRPRLYAVLFGIFAVVAAALAMVGVAGLIAYSVSDRRREIGIRMALGARPAQVMIELLGRSAFLTAGGILLGLAGAAATGRYLESFLFGVTRLDAFTYSSVALAFAALSTLAAAAPGRNAMRVDPIIALRSE